MQASRTYSQAVTEALKEMLLRGKLSPGDRVNEVVLSAELGISRAPIREALHMLVAEGLITHKPQRGKFITALTPTEIRHSYFVGGVLEGAGAAAKAAAFAEADFQGLEEVLHHMHHLVERGQDMGHLAPLDTAFHDIIFARIDNPLLKDLSRHSCQRVSKFLLFRHWQRAYTPAEFYVRHVQVLQALRSRDPQRIELCLRDHYTDSGERLANYGHKETR